MPRRRAILAPPKPVTKKSPNPVDVHVGYRVRVRRHAVGMSQEKLANAIGLTFQQVQKYEKGMNRMGSSRLQQVADVLGISPVYFFEGMARAPGASDDVATAINNFSNSPEGERLARAFMKLPLKVQRSVRWMVEEVADHAEAAS